MNQHTNQLNLFPQQNTDTRPPETVTWNLWHGCTKVSAGCQHCYMYRRDEAVGKDPSKHWPLICQSGYSSLGNIRVSTKSRPAPISTPASPLTSSIRLQMNGETRHGT